MGVSVVIPCLNEEKHIEVCVNSLLDNGYPNIDLEILIVDGGSTDNTLNIINNIKQKCESVKVLNNLKRKTPFALNLGIQNARFEKILISGAHASFPYGYIAHFDELTNRPHIDVAGGSLVTVPSDDSKKARAIAYVLSHPFGVGNSAFRIGVNQLMKVDTVPFGMYKREVFNKAGLYNEQLIRNHDIELSKRIAAKGFGIWLDPSFKCTYFARGNYNSLIKNNFDNGYWNIRAVLITKTLKSLSLRHFIPMLFLLALLTPLMLYFWLDYRAVFASDLIFISYLLVLLINTYFIERQRSVFLILSSFVSLHFSYGLGSLVALITFWKKD